MFTVTVWNMHQDPGSWDYFDRELACDVALLQEAPPSPGRPGIQKLVPRPGSRPWGSAVITDHPHSELLEVENFWTKGPVPLVRSNPEAVIAAVVELPDEEPIVAVSLYGIGDTGYSVTSVHRALSDLTPLMDSKLKHRVIVGGDLNCSSQLGAPDRVRHRNLFDRFESLGLVNLTELTHQCRPPLDGCDCDDDPCRHVQTFWRRGRRDREQNDPRRLQDDWVFASKPLAQRVAPDDPNAVRVVNEPESEAWDLSEHAPIRVTFA